MFNQKITLWICDTIEVDGLNNLRYILIYLYDLRILTDWFIPILLYGTVIVKIHLL